MVREVRQADKPPRSDEEIRRHVIEQLQWDERVEPGNITVEVRDGDVLLTGTVPTYGALRAAEQSARSVLGVRHVHCQIAVLLPNETKAPEDAEIRLNAINSLSWSPDIDPSDIEVSVEQGTVILDGAVESFAQKDHATDLIASLPGVRHVRNRLRVMPTGDMLDTAISDDILAALRRELPVCSIRIDVRDGVVTLDGTVPTAQARRTACRTAATTRGVLEVVCRLQIEASSSR